MNRRTGRKAWIFYEYKGKRTAIVNAHKLSAMADTYAADSLMRMKHNENRQFEFVVQIVCVRGRKPGALLVHRFQSSQGINGSAQQKPMI